MRSGVIFFIQALLMKMKIGEAFIVQVWQVLLIILAVLVAALVILYFVGKRLEKGRQLRKNRLTPQTERNNAGHR